MTIYCLKCKTQKEISDAVVAGTMYKGTCPHCGCKVGRFLKKAEKDALLADKA